MNNLILIDLVPNTGSNDAGLILFNKLKTAYNQKEIITLCVDANLSLSSSFLNSSIGLYIEKYGINSFKEIVKFKGNKAQFKKIANYIAMFSELEGIKC